MLCIYPTHLATTPHIQGRNPTQGRIQSRIPLPAQPVRTQPEAETPRFSLQLTFTPGAYFFVLPWDKRNLLRYQITHKAKC